MLEIDIAIIDSGINNNLVSNGKTILKYGECFDEVGHGTVVANLICRTRADARIHIFKVNNNFADISEKEVIETLEYIDKNINNCKLINISLGIEMISENQRLKDICKKLYEKNVIIVAAYNNFGKMSFPAAYDTVLGVDISPNIMKKSEFEYIEKSEINIRGFGGLLKVKWIEMPYIFVQGTSFLTAVVTQYLSELIDNKESCIEEIMTKFKNSYIIKTLNENHYLNHVSMSAKIKKAIVFPVNKETENLIYYYRDLDFEIEGIYDSKYSGNINRCVDDVIGRETSIKTKIKNIENVDWNGDFDSIIIGHTKELERISNKDYKMILLKNAYKYGKRVICFDDIDTEFDDLEIICPEKYSSNNNRWQRFGKLWDIPIPVVSIFGTSSQQGKFNLQMQLRKRFMLKGYRVGQLGSEPSSLLYGFDECFHFGYGSNCMLSGGEIVQVVNQKLKNILEKQVDIIITGCQSGTIPQSYCNVQNFTTSQIDFLLGCLPDAVLLVINPFDDIDYIYRTIMTIENIVNTRVVGLVIYPIMKKIDAVGKVKKQKLEEEDFLEFKNSLREKVGNIPVYNLFLDDQLDMMCEDLINYLSEQ